MRRSPTRCSTNRTSFFADQIEEGRYVGVENEVRSLLGQIATANAIQRSIVLATFRVGTGVA